VSMVAKHSGMLDALLAGRGGLWVVIEESVAVFFPFHYALAQM
jgi:hypothetical protein